MGLKGGMGWEIQCVENQVPSNRCQGRSRPRLIIVREHLINWTTPFFRFGKFGVP
jgi:hypothetical protein